MGMQMKFKSLYMSLENLEEKMLRCWQLLSLWGIGDQGRWFSGRLIVVLSFSCV